MLQVIQEETVAFNIPKHYLPKIVTIIQSGVLDLKGKTGLLHFDPEGNLREVEFPLKFRAINLTE